MEDYNLHEDALDIPGDAGRRIAQPTLESRNMKPKLQLSPMLCEVCGAERPNACGICRNCGNYMCAEG